MDVTGSIAETRQSVAAARRPGTIVGFVPTMGALHEGHGRLIDQARGECDYVVVSIFVNPTQFNDSADYRAYPRVIESDLAFCRQRGVDLVFAPDRDEMYPNRPVTFVEVGEVSEHLCGRFRPGHFRGVATVVAKLFNIVSPDRAYFGQKDAQQLAVIRRMVRDLDLPVAIAGVPTVREDDGLALSSRNRHLHPEERRLALALPRALRAAAEVIGSGERDPAAVVAAGTSAIPGHPSLRLEYLAVVDPDSMQPVERISGAVCVAGALWVGTTRLIDNVQAAAG